MKVAIIVLVALGATACSDRMEQHAAAGVDSTESTAQLAQSVPRKGDVASVTGAQLKGGDLLSSRSPGLHALTAEEANWLARHGYPTAEELDALATYDLDTLEASMRNRRDPKAAALVGHARALRGDIDGAVSAFAYGADLGSLYARQQLAIAATQQATGLPVAQLADADQGNLGILVSQLEVARMLGDHRAQALIDRYAVNFDWNAYGKHVLAQTAIFMDQYGEYARTTGSRAIGPDPRPNAVQWAQLERDPDALVTVYTRGRSYP